MCLLLCIAFSYGQTSPWHLNLSNSNIELARVQEDFQRAQLNEDLDPQEIQLFENWVVQWELRKDNKECLSHQNEIEQFKKSLAQQNNLGEDNSWKALGPDRFVDRSISGRTTFVKVHPENDHWIYVGTPSGGLWISKDGGETWSSPTDQLYNLGVSDLVFDINDPNIIYLATGDRDFSSTLTYGLVISYDGGETWSIAGLIPGEDFIPNIFKTNILQINEQYLLAATSHGVYYSSDEGFSWTASKGIDSYHVRYMEVHPEDPSILYASSISPEAGIFRSNDFGKSFQKIELTLDSEIDRLAIAVTPAAPQRVYVLAGSSSSSSGNDFVQMMISRDAGLSYQIVQADNQPILGNLSWFAWDISASKVDPETIFANGVSTYKSNDGGVTWVAASNDGKVFLSQNHHYSYFDPLGNLYVATSGGVYRSKDLAKNWEFISNGMNISEYNCISSESNELSSLIAGSQLKGTHKFDKQQWQLLYPGNAVYSIWDPNNSNIIYISLDNGQVLKSIDRGENFIPILKATSSIDGKNNSVPIALDPQNSSVIYAGKKSLYKSLDSGDTWLSIDVPLSSDENIDGFDFSTIDKDLSYLFSNNRIFRSTDGNMTYQLIANLDAGIQDIKADLFDPMRVIVCSGSEVLESYDKGLTWRNLGLELGSESKNVIALQNNFLRSVYLGTDSGVYYKDDSRETWIRYSEDLPRVRVNDLELLEKYKIVRAATNGRGVWENVFFEVNCDNEINFILPTVNVFDNDCDDLGSDELFWRFQWSICDDIEKYHFQIFDNDGAVYLSEDDLVDNVFIYRTDRPFENDQLKNWSYRIRAFRDDQWLDWGQKYYFDIEAKGTDCLGTYCDVAKEIELSSVISEPGPNIGFGGINDGQALSAGWYKFEAVNNGLVNIYSCGTDVDTRLWIYKGNCEKLELVAFSDDDCFTSNADNTASAVYDLKVEAGTSYYIEWDNYWSDDGFEWSIDVLYDLDCDIFYDTANNYEVGDGSTELDRENWLIRDPNFESIEVINNENPCGGDQVFYMPWNSGMYNLVDIKDAVVLEYRFKVYLNVGMNLHLTTDYDGASLPIASEGLRLYGKDSYWWSMDTGEYKSFDVELGSWIDIRIQLDLYGPNRYYVNNRLVGFGGIKNQNFRGFLFDGGEGDFLFDCVCVSTISQNCPKSIDISEGKFFSDDQSIYAQESIILSDRLEPNNIIMTAGEGLELDNGFELSPTNGLELKIGVCPD